MENYINNPKLTEMIEKAKERLTQIQSAKPVAKSVAKPNLFTSKLNDLLSGNSNGIVVKSSTEGSEKHFKITVNDEGKISAVEVTE